MLRLRTDAAHAIRFRGSMRKLFVGGILTPALSPGERESDAAALERS